MHSITYIFLKLSLPKSQIDAADNAVAAAAVAADDDAAAAAAAAALFAASSKPTQSPPLVGAGSGAIYRQQLEKQSCHLEWDAATAPPGDVVYNFYIQ